MATNAFSTSLAFGHLYTKSTKYRPSPKKKIPKMLHRLSVPPTLDFRFTVPVCPLPLSAFPFAHNHPCVPLS